MYLHRSAPFFHISKQSLLRCRHQLSRPRQYGFLCTYFCLVTIINRSNTYLALIEHVAMSLCERAIAAGLPIFPLYVNPNTSSHAMLARYLSLRKNQSEIPTRLLLMAESHSNSSSHPSSRARVRALQ